MYITQVYGIPLVKAIEFSVHIQSDVGGKITYVADLGIGRGWVCVGNTFDGLIQCIMDNVKVWNAVVNDPNQKLITNEDDITVIRQKINEWYKGV